MSTLLNTDLSSPSSLCLDVVSLGDVLFLPDNDSFEEDAILRVEVLSMGLGGVVACGCRAWTGGGFLCSGLGLDGAGYD